MIADFYWSPLALGQSLRKPIILGAKGLAEQVQHFLPSLKNWVHSLEPIRRKERTESHTLSSDLCMCAALHMYVQAHTQ